MEQAVIFDNLTTIFKKVFNDDTIVLKKELTAHDVSNWDSLSHMLMIAEVERSFEVKFKLKELGKLDNVGGLVELIEIKLWQK
ncbi:MAG: acyl carrier protein [Ferruginibacter sp.]